ncbi:MAG: amidophosphoribosyltransferase [Clostridia bacterium]|nr:amidophosphoribosyltransferase [Clostridia bacterium]MBQ8430180.1 amidophosphoribosyltransferase [Clostridia bacterium]
MAVFGIFGTETANVASSVYYGLYALQHRGQASSGIVVNDDGVFHAYKDSGIVNDVFNSNVLKSLGLGQMALGNVRYGTSDTKDRINAEPIVVNHSKGKMAISLDGKLVNAVELKTDMELQGSIFHTGNDVELISAVIIKERISSGSIEEAVCKAMDKLHGAYSLLVMSPQKLIAVRDKYGFKPLCYGQRSDGEYVVASESCALSSVGATFIRDIKPGEIVIFSKDGIRTIEEHCDKAPESLCVFEYLYTARPDSVIANCSVHYARKRAGAFLAKAHPTPADVVIGAPDSGIDAAIGYAEESGIPYGLGLIKNKYIGRTFIDPGQNVREDKVKIKLNPVSETVKGKRVILVDDSIVRGTTCARVVKLLRDAGAKEIHVRSSAPAFLNPCYYGTDIASRDVLIACNHTPEEMAKLFGADSVAFLPLEDVFKLADSGTCKGYCAACFDGKYPAGEPKCQDTNKYDLKISEKKN